MSSEAVRIARANRQMAQMAMVERLLFNPVVELIGGMAIIDQMYPQQSTSAEVVTTQTNTPFFGNPLWFVQQIFSNKETTVTTEARNSSNDRAKNTLMWVILAQQVAPAISGMAQVGAGAVGLLRGGK